MEMKVHKCPECGASLKYGKDKAGRPTKCPQCNTEMVLPADEDAARPKAANPDPDDDAGGYGVAFVDDEADKRKRDEAHAKKLAKKLAPKIKVRRKNIGDLEAWRKVYNGLLFLMIGACVWGGAFGLHALVIFLGLIQGPEIGINAERFLMPPPQPPAVVGEGAALDMPMFFLSLVSGSDFLNTARVLMIVSQVLLIVMAALWMIGYGMCLPIENRLGTKGQLIALFSLSGTNILLNLLFRFLPLIGALSYVLVPFYAPEVIMSEINTERAQPIFLAWCWSPTWEILLAFLVRTVMMLEPILIAIFIWTIALMVRDEPMELRALGVMKMGFGVVFMILAYYMYSCAGTSSVLVKVERVIYLLWFAFQVGFIVKLATLCHAARDLINFYLSPDQ
jgi:hypothetical protein